MVGQQLRAGAGCAGEVNTAGTCITLRMADEVLAARKFSQQVESSCYVDYICCKHVADIRHGAIKRQMRPPNCLSLSGTVCSIDNDCMLIGRDWRGGSRSRGWITPDAPGKAIFRIPEAQPKHVN